MTGVLVDPLSWGIYSLAIALGVVLVRKNPNPRGLAQAALTLCLAAMAACFLGLMLGHSVFGAMRALCWGGFVAAPLGLLTGALFVRGGWRWASLAGGLLLAGLGLEGFVLGPSGLEVNTVQVHSDKLSEPLRIVVLSDIQTDHVDDYTREAIALGLAQRPDLVLLPGDYIQRDWREGWALEPESRALRAAFVEAGLGEVPWVAVSGDIDDSSWPAHFAGIPNGTATPRTETVTLDRVVVDALSVRDSRASALQVAEQGALHIVLGHAPDFALGRPVGDILVAGHTHGGQVVLPFIGPLMTLTELPRDQASGHTTLDNGSELFVSRGIGMERIDAPRIRLFCRPEVLVIEVLPGP
jgi:predicted MPP superfamily phosphohydrolase